MEETASRFDLDARVTHRHERAYGQRKGCCQPGLGQSESDAPRVRGGHALRRIDHPLQARVEEPAHAGNRDRDYSGCESGWGGSHELRAHHVDLQTRPLARACCELLMGSAFSLTGEVMAYESKYKAMLTDSCSAVEQIGSDSIVAIGQAVCQPPALMEALAARAEAANIDNVKVYYMHAEENMKRSLLRYELMGRIKPYCMFIQEAERDLIKKGQQDG